ncbi:hypothetical protein [Bordetella parapertussis]|uniref:hypothetical protein n=1 Tax=Bordetella parapertussis TaxID=519 RepID=UPI0013E8E370|nr:hypothetical protein [Bordetella parapertussis]
MRSGPRDTHAPVLRWTISPTSPTNDAGAAGDTSTPDSSVPRSTRRRTPWPRRCASPPSPAALSTTASAPGPAWNAAAASPDAEAARPAASIRTAMSACVNREAARESTVETRHIQGSPRLRGAARTQPAPSRKRHDRSTTPAPRRRAAGAKGSRLNVMISISS